jgi:ribosomal protein L12E/L44/L45/RPP1/RPP2
MTKLLSAIVAGFFAVASIAPAFAADEKKDEKSMEKKDNKKKDEKKSESK